MKSSTFTQQPMDNINKRSHLAFASRDFLLYAVCLICAWMFITISPVVRSVKSITALKALPVRGKGPMIQKYASQSFLLKQQCYCFNVTKAGTRWSIDPFKLLNSGY